MTCDLCGERFVDFNGGTCLGCGKPMTMQQLQEAHYPEGPEPALAEWDPPPEPEEEPSGA